MGKAGRDLGNYSAASAQTVWDTTKNGSHNLKEGSQTLLHRGLDGMEFLGKGGAGIIGGTIDGILSGFSLGSTDKPEKSPLPKGNSAPIPSSSAQTNATSKPNR